MTLKWKLLAAGHSHCAAVGTEQATPQTTPSKWTPGLALGALPQLGQMEIDLKAPKQRTNAATSDERSFTKKLLQSWSHTAAEGLKGDGRHHLALGEASPSTQSELSVLCEQRNEKIAASSPHSDFDSDFAVSDFSDMSTHQVDDESTVYIQSPSKSGSLVQHSRQSPPRQNGVPAAAAVDAQQQQARLLQEFGQMQQMVVLLTAQLEHSEKEKAVVQTTLEERVVASRLLEGQAAALEAKVALLVSTK